MRRTRLALYYIAFWAFGFCYASSLEELCIEYVAGAFERLPKKSIEREVNNLKWLRKVNREGLSTIKEPVTEKDRIPSIVKRNRERGSSMSVKKTLSAYDIPEAFWKYYDPETGVFKYSPPKVNRLALENGDAKLKAVRINAFLRKNVAPIKFDEDRVKLAIELDVPIHSRVLKISEKSIQDYFKAMESIPDFELIIITPEKYLNDVNEIIGVAKSNIKNRVKVLKSEQGFTTDGIWAQDGSKPLESGELSTYFQNSGNTVIRDSYRRISQALVNGGTARIVKSIFNFEGGNVIVGDKHIFLGPGVINNMAEILKVSRKEVMNAFAVEFGKPIIEVGYAKQSGKTEEVMIHIDLSFAILKNRSSKHSGDEVIVLSSPEEFFSKFLGIEKVSNLSRDEYHQVMKDFFKNLKINYENNKITESELAIFAGLGKISYENILIQIEKTNYLRKIFQNHGYPVADIAGLDLRDAGGFNPSFLELKILNFTNLIASGDKLIIPGYGKSRFNDYSDKFFNELGFEVVHADSSKESLCNNGGVRCLSETYRYLP